jgi:hypothetical protein
VAKVVFYNRADCCAYRANQAVLTLLDANRQQVDAVLLTGDMVQIFDFQQCSSCPVDMTKITGGMPCCCTPGWTTASQLTSMVIKSRGTVTADLPFASCLGNSCSLNLANWNSVLTGGHWNASFEVQGERLFLKNRPVIRTIQRFLAGNFPINISGSFRSSGSDALSIVTRSNAVLTDYWREAEFGLQFRLDFTGWGTSPDPFISIHKDMKPPETSTGYCQFSGWAFQSSTWHKFSLIDGGSEAQVYIDNQLYATCSNVSAAMWPGDYVLVYNIERGSNGMELGPITITTPSYVLANAAVPLKVTLTGLKMGAASAAGNITVQTSADPVPSYPPVSSGVIGGAVTSVMFDVAAADRLAGKAGVAATFSFVITAGGALVANSKITLSYPANLFALTGTPRIQMSGSGGTGSVSAQTSTRIMAPPRRPGAAASPAAPACPGRARCRC